MQVGPRVPAATSEEVTDRGILRLGFIALCATCTNATPTSSSARPGADSQGPLEGPPSSSSLRSAQAPIAIATVLHFPPEVATPGPALGPELDRVAEVLRANPTVRVEIHGHADPKEAEGVAHARANLVASGLAARGVPRTRSTVRAHGHSQPAADGKHGRVEFVVLPGQ